jgi:hypothetical protein
VLLNDRVEKAKGPELWLQSLEASVHYSLRVQLAAVLVDVWTALVSPSPSIDQVDWEWMLRAPLQSLLLACGLVLTALITRCLSGQAGANDAATDGEVCHLTFDVPPCCCASMHVQECFVISLLIHACVSAMSSSH